MVSTWLYTRLLWIDDPLSNNNIYNNVKGAQCHHDKVLSDNVMGYHMKMMTEMG